MKNILGVIPARMASTRFYGKPLAMIAGKTMIERVYQQACKAASLTKVVIATDSQEIRQTASQFGAEVVMTSAEHPSGLDRIIEVAAKFNNFSHYINIQGDEPLIAPQTINVVANLFEVSQCDVSTAAIAIKNKADYEDPNKVKVVLNTKGHALYFSRSPLPYYRDFDMFKSNPPLKHLGIYGYTHEALNKIVTMKQHPLELAEQLEQLRFLANGLTIGVVQVEHESLGVDVPSDIDIVESMLLNFTKED